ncbi:MAG: hypothetical protein ACTHZ9_11230 [Leucobacter sp.]
MSIAPFTPIGEKSRKDYALDVLREHSTGDVIEYETFSDRVGSDDRRIVQAAVRDAAKDFLQLNQHAVEAVPNLGYRIVEPGDHLRLAEKRRKSSLVNLRKGEELVSSVDYNELSDEGRRLAEGMAMGFSRLIEANRRMDARLAVVERAQDAVVIHQERTDEEVTELKERLARLESVSLKGDIS